MLNIPYAVITNNCSVSIRVFIRRPRPMRTSSGKHLAEIPVPPKHKTCPLPYHLLVGAKGWKDLQKMECVHIAQMDYEPRFAQIHNASSENLVIAITPDVEIEKRQKTSIMVPPKKPSRSIDRRSIDRLPELEELEQQRRVKITPVRYIGPPTGARGAVGSYLGESVYICYECGGPIIFRGYPPRPIHI